MNSFPTGTVTFLFTDIEGSTNLAQTYPQVWESLRARHHEILHNAIESHNGHVFQIVGDEFCAAFHTAPDALNAALSAQLVLQSEDWKPAPVKVRMGINTGAAQFGKGSGVSDDYTGYSTLVRVARVMSAGHGGQILLSGSSAELVRGELPEGVSLRDMGQNRLKGLLNLERLWQVEVPGLARDFPPLRTLNTFPNNLPPQLTSFIGREKEIAELKQTLADYRLVTLVGSGGTGKTRLSLQVAADMLDLFPDGVWFVEFAPLSNPELVPQTILSALSLAEQKGRTALQTLEDYLHDKRLMLILDNCEHLIEVCAKTTQAILSASPTMKIMATSRESLRIGGEVAWHVPSLSLPNPKELPELDQLTQYEAVHLFIDRVQLVSPHYAVIKENASAIAQICYRLDGIPLAIELAAARVRSMSVEQIMSRLDDRFRLLTGGSRTALPRQQTLRALIDWSYDLLTDSEKLLLRRLAVFSGGWTLELAEQICADEKLEALDILDILTHLVEKSLVAVDEEHGDMRYHILETVRQYAREKLFESGEGVEIRHRHCDVFTNLVELAEPGLKKDNRKKWNRVLETQQENVRSALWWSLENKDTSHAIRICNSLEYYWDTHGLYQEGYTFYKEAFDLAGKDNSIATTEDYAILWANKINYSVTVNLNLQTDPAILEETRNVTLLLERLKFPPNSYIAFSALAELYTVRNDIDSAEQVILKLLKGSRAVGNQENIARALSALAYIYAEKGDSKKSDALDAEARDLFLMIGNSATALRHADDLSRKDFFRGNLEAVQKHFEASLVAYKGWEENFRIERTLWMLADLAGLRGNYELANKYYMESEIYAKRIANQNWQSIHNLMNKGALAFLVGDVEKACQYYESAIDGIKENRADEFIGGVMIDYGLALLRAGHLEDARHYFEKSIVLMEKVGSANSTGFSWYGIGELERLAGNISAAISNFQRALLIQYRFERYIYTPELFDSFAKLSLMQKDLVQSARWFGIADGLRQKFGIVLPPVFRPDHDKHVELLKGQMSAEEFASAWADGADTELKDAVALALQGFEPELDKPK